ncbi:MAG: alpha/beta hydrolase, partial [Planctomycetota bacterium]
MPRYLIPATCFLLELIAFQVTAQNQRPQPTHSDLPYGPNPGQVIDIYLAQSSSPTPLVLYIHGGGFTGGSKTDINATILKQLLDAGITVASVGYRLIPEHPLPAAHRDAARAIQFLRANANRFNLDPMRVGAFGGSAGAQL